MNTLQKCTTAPVSKENSTLYYEPRFFVERSENETQVRVELPGVKKEDLAITVEKRELILEGKANIQTPESWKLLHRESADRTYRLRLRISDDVDQKAIRADLENGVLLLAFPKAEAAKPQKIKIN